LTGVVVREVKKLAAGLLWNDRIVGDLKADFEATAMVEVSLNDCRIVKAILDDTCGYQSTMVVDEDDGLC
jgi:hypothetical protein